LEFSGLLWHLRAIESSYQAPSDFAIENAKEHTRARNNGKLFLLMELSETQQENLLVHLFRRFYQSPLEALRSQSFCIGGLGRDCCR
jgi:hypothetical protein